MVTPKKLTVVLGGRHAVHQTVSAVTVGQALKALHVTLGRHDVVRPGLHHVLGDGDKLVLTRIRIVKKHVAGEAISYSTVTRDDSSMAQGQSTLVRAGRTGSRDVTYRITFRNGHLVARQVITQHVLRDPVARIERVGTKAAASNLASGSTVWDAARPVRVGRQLGHQHRQRLLRRSAVLRSAPGRRTAAPACRATTRRETQIAIATKVRNASGGYGAWPACAASLGLPR